MEKRLSDVLSVIDIISLFGAECEKEIQLRKCTEITLKKIIIYGTVFLFYVHVSKTLL